MGAEKQRRRDAAGTYLVQQDVPGATEMRQAWRRIGAGTQLGEADVSGAVELSDASRRRAQCAWAFPAIRMGVAGRIPVFGDSVEAWLDLIVPGGWWLTDHQLSNPQDSACWLFRSTGCIDQCSVTTVPVKEFNIEWNELVAYEEDTMIIGLDQAIDEKETELLKTRPAPYHPFLSPLGSPLAASLPRHRKFDHAIDLEPGTTAPWGAIYSLLAKEL